VLLQLNKAGEAADELRKVLETNPKFSAARLDLGLAHFRMGDREGAQREWEAVRQQEPHSAQVRAYISLLDKQ
jgi:thioredoxin-like negative regulator of GroEL